MKVLMIVIIFDTGAFVISVLLVPILQIGTDLTFPNYTNEGSTMLPSLKGYNMVQVILYKNQLG